MKNKKTLLYSVIATATLLIGVVGATYAYFVAKTGTGATTPININAGTTDSLVFTPCAGNALSITATQQNHGAGAGDKTATCSPKVTLTAASSATATYCYTTTLNISSNNFVYTSGTTPELTFTMLKNGTAIYSSYDITTRTTALTVPISNGSATVKHTITTSAGTTKTDTFAPTITFKNLDSDQQNNSGKAFTGTISFTRVSC